MSDRYISLTKRVIAKVADGGGSYSETLTDTTFQGFIVEMSASEIYRNSQIGIEAVAFLFTESDLDEQNRVLNGSIEYEITAKFTQFHKRYSLKRIK